ncbi:zinc finger protein 40 [Nephila pilipes]|uniref:Zinc finger protein 40 n=1 Tax=Nephila pilipes TaxID=299642 RepID=A0A8X6PVJ5_NEPPI|nr:zinc finger protein 40 [Nephila pilipes]
MEDFFSTNVTRMTLDNPTGGYIKKRTDPGILLIQNESFKHFSTSNDLVFKLKKTVSSNIPPPTNNNEKTEREHLEASKSLNDTNMVSQHEVNNNIIKHVQDIINTNESEKCDESCKVRGKDNTRKNLTVDASGVSNVSVNNSFSSFLTSNGVQKQTLLMIHNAVETPLLQISNYSASENVADFEIASEKISSQTVEGVDNIDECELRETEIEKQNVEMSGVSPSVNSKEKIGNTTDSQQMNYRISASENRINYLKEAASPVLEQNCQLPSSVYGTPASNIEKVLTGFQVSEKDSKSNTVAHGKISFLQEILEKEYSKKQINSTSVSGFNEDANNCTKSNYSEVNGVITCVNQPNVSFYESKDSSKNDSVSLTKLKLHIPDNLCNDDSNSSALSVESQKTLKFPKITSPKILEQHISKIISENAAIVETLDPVWSRRFFKQTAQNSIPSHEGDSKKISVKTNRSNEDKNLLSVSENSNKSKLHTALLGGCEGEGLYNTKITSTSSVSVISSKDRNFSQFGNLSTTVPSVSMYSKIASSVSEDDLKGSAIKSLLSLKQTRYSKHKKSSCTDKEMGGLHPQNPEGSIIKDLLLKSKSQEDLKVDSDMEDRSLLSNSFSSDAVHDMNDQSETPVLIFKCPQCSTEFSDKYNFDVHLSFCDATNHLLHLRNSSAKFKLKEANAQSKPLGALYFQNKVAESSREKTLNIDLTESMDNEVGPILKKQLLMPRSPPTKRRKVSDSLLLGSSVVNHTPNLNDNTKVLSNLDILPHRGRSQSVHLFGGEVQVMDGTKTKKIKIKTTLPGAFSITNKFSNIKKSKMSDDLEIEKDSSSSPGVIVTIAQHIHKSGGTVHLPTRRSASNISPVVRELIASISDSIPKYQKLETLPVSDYTRTGHPSELFKSFDDRKESSVQSLSYPCDFFPGPDSKTFPTAMHVSRSSKNDLMPVIDELSPGSIKVALSPGNKPFYSPIFPASEKSFDLLLAARPPDKVSANQPIVPTVLFTPSSPTMPSTESENTFTSVTSSISEPTKKFLAPARPTTLPLKKKPFTMVSSTLVSPDTPRPKKSCGQLFLNGHAYTYLGLKCSTRSTYCCIYRPQPMFVLQETNPKLSMYSNWQVMPAKEELSGLTPGQMISFYCSKQRKESKLITVNGKLGEPLIFTHSSYWTYRSQDLVESKESCKLNINSNQIKDLQLPSENPQESKPGENPFSDSSISSHGTKTDRPPVLSADESSTHVDTENTLSDDPNNSNDEDDEDDCQDDGTGSLTDSSQPQPPKRVKIFEGGFKSNEDYTYVRGRGRGKYVCEECGIRCKKPSMLKKHIRTHTDLRPYKCRHCSFAFKTKGNLTKHMKSKAHHKKCTELGIIPVPTTTDDSQIDEEALAKQIEKKKIQFSDGEDADDDEDEDTDESEDECESDTSSMILSNQKNRMLANGHSKKSDSQEKISINTSEETTREADSVSQQTLEQEAVRSLLNLSALGEPSQWSISTGDLTDVTSTSETEAGSITVRSDQSLLSPSQLSSHNISIISSRPKNVSDQWLSTEALGHRPRSYSADVPQSSGKDALAKFKLSRAVNSETLTTPVEESSEFGGREQYTRRYSISVAREARKPLLLNPPEWSRLDNNTLQSKWLEGESSDQPMDLSITREHSKCKSVYAAGMAGSLINIAPQENGPDSNLDTFGESYQLKSLPVLSPQVLVDYEAGCSNSNSETSLLPLTDEQTSFGPGTSTRSLYYISDVPTSDTVPSRKEGDASEDPSSPDIVDYAVCSPASPPNLEDSSYYYPQDNMSQASTNSEEAASSRFRAEFIVPTSSSSGMEEGKCICRICNKTFAKSSHLRLHVNIHYFERPFRCDNCAVSFRTKGHLQKHKRSVSHYNKVNMNLTFGTPTVDNPRPFKCADCKIAFRIHGHLAKHLRSKMHIMKLECLGKLPFGMYAEMERSGVSLNEIDTTDCNNSLESLQVMAQKLYQRDPRRMRWQGPEQTSDTGCVIVTPPANALIDSMLPINEPLAASFDSVCAPIGIPVSTLTSSMHPSENDEVKQELAETDALRLASAFSESDSAISPLSRFIISQPNVAANQETTQRVEVSENDSAVSLNRSGTCHLCGRLFKSAKFLQVHLYCDHPNWNPPSTSEAPSPNSSISSASNSHELICNLCGKQYANQKELQQHLLSHAQPRPFVCELCDAGFTSSSSLVAHKATHQNNSSVSSNVESRSVQLK